MKSATKFYKEREHELENGLYFWLQDQFNTLQSTASVKAKAKPKDADNELNALLGQYNLRIDRATAKFGRDAFYINFPDGSQAQSLFPEHSLSGHITVDRLSLAPTRGETANDRSKWEYCHYTEQYQDPVTKIGYNARIYFNKVGEIVNQTLTESITDPTSKEVTIISKRALHDDELSKIALNIEHASTIIKDLIQLKEHAYKNARDVAYQASKEIHSMAKEKPNIAKSALKKSGKKKSTKATDDDDESIARLTIDNNIDTIRNAMYTAARYADNYLTTSDEIITKLLAKINAQTESNIASNDNPFAALAEEEDEETAAVDEAVSTQPNVSASISQPSIIAEAGTNSLNTIYAKIKELHNKAERIIAEASNFQFKNIYELELISLNFSELLEEASKLQLKNSEKDTLRKSIIEQLVAVNSFKATTTLQEQLLPENISLKFLQDNFHAIEMDIPEQFYIDMLNLAVGKPNNNTKYIEICKFLGKNSNEYLALLKPPYISETKESPFAINLLETCFKNNNLDAFKMLLEHGVKLGTNVFVDNEPIGDTVFKFLMIFFVRQYVWAKRIDDENETIIQDRIKRIIAFLTIMFEPTFKAGFAYQHSLHGQLSKNALKFIMQHTRALKQQAERPTKTSKQQAERPAPAQMSTSASLLAQGTFSILDLAISMKLPAQIIALIASNVEATDLQLRSFTKCYAEYICNNSFNIAINDDGSYGTQKVTCLSEEKVPELMQYLNEKAATPPAGNINPYIYVVPVREYKKNLSGKHTIAVLDKLNALFLDKIRDLDYRQDIEPMVKDMLKEANTQSNEKMSHQYLGAFLLLINTTPPNSRAVQHYSYMFAALLRLGSKTQDHPAILLRYVYFNYANKILREAEAVPAGQKRDALLDALNGVLEETKYTRAQVEANADKFLEILDQKYFGGEDFGQKEKREKRPGLRL